MAWPPANRFNFWLAYLLSWGLSDPSGSLPWRMVSGLPRSPTVSYFLAQTGRIGIRLLQLQPFLQTAPGHPLSIY